MSKKGKQAKKERLQRARERDTLAIERERGVLLRRLEWMIDTKAIIVDDKQDTLDDIRQAKSMCELQALRTFYEIQ